MKTLQSLWLTSVLVVLACTEKKEAPKPAPVEPPKPAVVAKPPPAVEPRVDKECAAPIDPGPTTDITIAGRAAKLSGARLTFADKDADGTLTLGVVGPLNEDSGENMVNVKKYVKYFQEQKVDAILVTGDVGETAPGIARALKEFAASKLPVFAVIGNRECRADFTDGVNAANAETQGAVINLNQVRVVEFPELMLVTLPGYHNPEYMGCATGCVYLKSTVEEVIREAKAATIPVALVSHGPPQGKGTQALDSATNNGGNVGDPVVGKAIADGHIGFGFFSNIKEAGGRATTDVAGETLLKEKTPSKTLFLNPGPADSFGWAMNDGTTAVGMVAVFKFKDGQASWEQFRAKPLTSGEKATAKTLAPPAAPKAEGTPAPTPAPVPTLP
ncbi:MAG: hypothetical protein JNG84_03195 [Archangium sp.]|nr:hypothetical protein [Archangium sp.]